MVKATGAGADQKSAYYRCPDDGEPLGFDEPEAVDEAHACGNKEESEVLHKKVRHAVDPHQTHYAQLKGGREQQHPDDA